MISGAIIIIIITVHKWWLQVLPAPERSDTLYTSSFTIDHACQVYFVYLLTDVVWSSERHCIYGFMALYKYFIIIIIIKMKSKYFVVHFNEGIYKLFFFQTKHKFDADASFKSTN